MAGNRRPIYLSCFYCGRRSSQRNDGVTRQFTCNWCEATNYLDQNGEITDPPVSKTAREGASTRFANAGLTPPKSSSEASSVFCVQCLENQRLFTASLAQYLPEDPDSPDYAQAERDYYRFRKGLERRYPQICVDCEPRVLEKIRQAGYTAKTDHLRRMIDRNRADRVGTQHSWLHAASTVGRYLRLAGLALQLLWHVSVLQRVVADHAAGDEGAFWIQQAAKLAGQVVDYLPAPDVMLRDSMVATICSLWWNPYFAQSVRGFTRHVVGLSTWYTYQAMIVLLRALLVPAATLSTTHASRLDTQVGGHLFMALFSIYVHFLANGSVRTDPAPLFGHGEVNPKPNPAVTQRQQQQQRKQQQQQRKQQQQQRKQQQQQRKQQQQQRKQQQQQQVAEDSMANVLDEILQSSPGRAAQEDLYQAQSGTNRRATATDSPWHFSQPASSSLETQVGFGSLNLSGDAGLSAAPLAQADQSDEMDWSPTVSPHRAFNSYRPDLRQNQGFGQTPVEPKASPIWYKVPPAPVSPAERRFKPAAAPIRKSPIAKGEFKFRPAAGTKASTTGSSSDGTDTSNIAFAAPKFFAPGEEPHDPRNSLTDMFGESLSLGRGDEQDAAAAARKAGGAVRTAPSAMRRAEVALLLIAFVGWLHAMTVQHAYSVQVTIATAVCCALISTRATGEALGEFRAQSPQAPRWRTAVGTVFGVSEFCMAALLGVQVWSGKNNDAITSQGGWLIGLMISHQLCNMIL